MISMKQYRYLFNKTCNNERILQDMLSMFGLKAKTFDNKTTTSTNMSATKHNKIDLKVLNSYLADTVDSHCAFLTSSLLLLSAF